MRTTISGKKIAEEMAKIAKDCFKERPNVGCVCVGVANIGRTAGKKNRQVDGQERDAFFAWSGDAGRAELRNALNEERVEGEDELSNANIVGMLEGMAKRLALYESARAGTSINQVETWATHNCAESNLALYLERNGKNFSSITIASYEIRGSGVAYKPLCHNCQQWVRLYFNILQGYRAEVKQ